jgi:hemerythrin-like metal-binding protein
VVERATKLSGLCPEDWATLASSRRVTCAWSPAVGALWRKVVSSSGVLDESIAGAQLDDLEQGVAFWFERLVSSENEQELWRETTFLGLSHAAAGFPNAVLLAFLNRLGGLVTINAAKALAIEQAVAVGAAFTRIAGVAIALTAHAHHLGVDSAVAQLGVGPHLMARLRGELVPKLIANGQGSIALMSWNDSLASGVGELDGWHQELVDRLDRLHRAKSTEHGPELGLALQELADGLVEQAAVEERLYAAHGVPELEQHQQLHRQLLTRVMVFVEQWRTTQVAEQLEPFARTFRGWFSEHLRGADRTAGLFLRAQGVR